MKEEIHEDLTKELIVDGWFMEKNVQWPGQAMALQVEEVILARKSKFQDVLVFKSTHHGMVLVLDGVIQCTEFDEYCYQEMLTFLPLNCHPDPRDVLIIGVVMEGSRGRSSNIRPSNPSR